LNVSKYILHNLYWTVDMTMVTNAGDIKSEYSI